MKNVLLVMLTVTLFFASCKKDDVGPSILTVNVQLNYPSGSSFTAKEGVTVKVTSSASSYEAKTDAGGKAVFTLPVGVYEASATDSRSSNGRSYVYNGVKSGISVAANWVSSDVVSLDLVESQRSQVIIKEVFVGGTPNDAGSGVFLYDRYIVLYNNSDAVADLSKLCLATIAPYNSTGSNAYIVGGQLSYANAGWIPAGQAFWYFQQNVTLDPGKQLVIAIANAVNNTVTYSKSINFDNSSYYATYDIATFTHAATYVTPAASIPATQYLKAYRYGLGTAWTLSVTSPGLFLFNVANTTPVAFGADVSQNDQQGAALTSKKVPVSWVIDAVEAFQLNDNDNKKRFPATVDAGYVYHANRSGYSIYRNVDKAATEAIATNAGKIVSGYNFGTTSLGGSSDPSGIDAEASIKAGARIIFKDDNNATNDFHLRSQAALRN
ncbi:DUF4876 domain-containing protein [Terrimonas sp. NA20]|uniref:DUF4876 domain-containing protein n=1 Tax=Terrimonas ginsenosidimutans TaxID=2908004 RepID=A0ABS9KLL3_9BACT|nr:DUF4876 domain-containing protein [Terrimonas ginsenosidimutans]MCG2613196.1 DUF4876 domain-containing protein [Terrimonas ginsenosidimutans]